MEENVHSEIEEIVLTACLDRNVVPSRENASLSTFFGYFVLWQLLRSMGEKRRDSKIAD